LNFSYTRKTGQDEQAAEKLIYFVIPSEARNLSFFSWACIEERFLASLGMTKMVGTFSASSEVCPTEIATLLNLNFHSST
jgi:hypothetical protein